MFKYKYSVELNKFNEAKQEYEWVVDIRFYNGRKDLNDFDLCDIPDKRKNAKLISIVGDNGIEMLPYCNNQYIKKYGNENYNYWLNQLP
jgi:hypothetical protein